VTLPGLVEGTVYHYRIIAQDSVGNAGSTADATFTTVFVVDETAPQISNVNVAPSETSAVVSWQTDELSVGVVEYGLTASYELGVVSSATLGTAHAVTLPGLVEGTVYHYRIIAQDSVGNAGSTADATFTTVPAGGGGGGRAGIVSDDFHTGVLNTGLWTVVDPQGDGTVELVGAGTPDAHLELSVPAGTVHDPWRTNTALRVMQPARDEDFEIEAKFVSEATEQYQNHGLLVEEDDTNFIRFDVFSDGTGLHLYSASLTNGVPSQKVNDIIGSAPTMYLRLARTGDQWTGWYSYDGVIWVTAVSFSHSLTVTSVGVFGGNYTPNPAYTAVVDYFVETSAPIGP